MSRDCHVCRSSTQGVPTRIWLTSRFLSSPASLSCFQLWPPCALSRIICVSCIHATKTKRHVPRSQFGWICFPDGPNPLVTNPHVLCPCGMQCAHVVCLCAHVVCLPPTTPPTSHASLPHTAHIHAHTRMHTNGCALIGTRKETVNVMTQTLSVDTVSTER